MYVEILFWVKNDTVTFGSVQCIVVLLRRHLISCVHIFSFLFFLLVFVIIITHRYPDLAILSFLFWFCSVRWKTRSAECGKWGLWKHGQEMFKGFFFALDGCLMAEAEGTKSSSNYLRTCNYGHNTIKEYYGIIGYPCSTFSTLHIFHAPRFPDSALLVFHLAVQYHLQKLIRGVLVLIWEKVAIYRLCNWHHSLRFLGFLASATFSLACSACRAIFQ